MKTGKLSNARLFNATAAGAIVAPLVGYFDAEAAFALSCMVALVALCLAAFTPTVAFFSPEDIDIEIVTKDDDDDRRPSA